MSEIYYREKVVKLHNKLFLSTKSARFNFIDNDDHWDTAYMASKTIKDDATIREWDRVWSELTKKKSPYIERSDFVHTILSKQNRSLEKYLLFVLEQYGEVIRK